MEVVVVIKPQDIRQFVVGSRCRLFGYAHTHSPTHTQITNTLTQHGSAQLGLAHAYEILAPRWSGECMWEETTITYNPRAGQGSGWFIPTSIHNRLAHMLCYGGLSHVASSRAGRTAAVALMLGQARLCMT